MESMKEYLEKLQRPDKSTNVDAEAVIDYVKELIYRHNEFFAEEVYKELAVDVFRQVLEAYTKHITKIKEDM